MNVEFESYLSSWITNSQVDIIGCSALELWGINLWHWILFNFVYSWVHLCLQFQHTPQHLVRLLQIIVDGSCDMAVRQVASIHFKNFVAKNWCPHDPGNDLIIYPHKQVKEKKKKRKEEEDLFLYGIKWKIIFHDIFISGCLKLVFMEKFVLM